MLENAGDILMLLIDKRERSELAELVQKRAEMLHVPFEMKWLEIGDYIIQSEPSVCFEAKSISDFLGSVRNKRLFNQMDNMVDAYDTNIVIIHGHLEEAVGYVDTLNIRWRNKLKGMICGAIASINLHTNIKCIWVPSVDEAAHIIMASCTQVKKPLILTKQLPKKTRSDDARVDVLCGIDGISAAKAKKLLAEFGSIYEIGASSPEELTVIKGVGKVIAGNIIKTLNSEKVVKL